MDFNNCVVCGQKFKKCKKVQEQAYCSAVACQKERKRRWQREYRKSEVYKDNQKRAQNNWAKKNPEYWNDYHRTHPEYRERDQQLQRHRNDKRKKN